MYSVRGEHRQRVSRQCLSKARPATGIHLFFNDLLWNVKSAHQILIFSLDSLVCGTMHWMALKDGWRWIVQLKDNSINMLEIQVCIYGWCTIYKELTWFRTRWQGQLPLFPFSYKVVFLVHPIREYQYLIFRYHYFLQLKMDVLEGKISCDAKQAVQLASYSMQGEILCSWWEKKLLCDCCFNLIFLLQLSLGIMIWRDILLNISKTLHYFQRFVCFPK